MVNKKIPIDPNAAEVELENRVDAMMQPVRISVTHDDSTTTQNPQTTRRIDIFSDPKTAPKVPAGLVDELNASEPGEWPSSSTPIAVTTTPVTATAPTLPPTAAPSATKPIITPTTAPLVTVPQLVKNPSTAIVPRRNYEPAPSTTEADVPIPPLQIDDSTTDAAVDDIATKEGDELLAARDAMQQNGAKTGFKPAKKRRRHIRKLWFVLLLLGLGLIIAAAIPASRYRVAGLVVKKELQVQVLDSTTQTPVSKAVVIVRGQSAITDGNGVAKLRVGVGTHHVAVTKQYYTDTFTSTFKDFTGDEPLAIKLVATGRQVPITVVDRFTGEPIAAAEISLLNTSAKTNQQGKAIIVLPAQTGSVTGKISAANFNDGTVKVTVTNMAVEANTFKLTSTGKVYFLSNEQGTIDVVKANLDGTARKTVIKGTGKEDANTTSLLASRDWRFAVLKSQRTGAQASLYLLDTKTDKLSEFDSGDAMFTPIGWQGHTFLYDVVRNTVAMSQSGHEIIRSYDADRGQLNQLDQNQVDGTGDTFSYQGFYNFYLMDDMLVYNTEWYSAGGADLSKKNNTIRGVQTNGQNKKDFQTIGAAGLGYVQSALAKPQQIYYGAYNVMDAKTTFYEYKNAAVSPSAAVSQASFNRLYPSYMASPSGQQVVWSELRDGKQTVLLGDANADNSKVIAKLAGYSIYGWYGSDYLLVSKNDSELYVVAKEGSGAPQKLTDYFKSAQAEPGYGYGGF